MEDNTHIQEVTQIIKTIYSLQTKITTIIDEFKNYIKYLQDREIELDENLEEEEKMTKTLEILNKIDKFVECKKNLHSNSKQTLEIIKTIKSEVKNLMEKLSSNEDSLTIETNNKLIDYIQQKNAELHKKEIELLHQQISEISKKYEKEQEELQEKRIHYGQYKLKSEGIIHNNEMEQIEEWTTMKFGDVLFDSNEDD